MIQSALIDVALWLYHAFFVPGDRFLSKFPELDVAGHGRVVSGLLSAVVWLGAIVLIVVIYRLIRDLDRALTAFVIRLYEELQRAVASRRETADHCLSSPTHSSGRRDWREPKSSSSLP